MTIFVRVLLFSMLLASCSSTKKKLLGKWQMQKVYEQETDMSHIHNPKDDRWIEFYADGSFESGGTPYGKNTGKYILGKNKQTLSLDSDAGEEDDSKWTVSVEKGKMIWIGVGSARQRTTRVLYEKVK